MTSIAQNFLSIQETLNQKLSLEWKEKGWPYPDAMFTEATEAYNHLNWEWWRAIDRKIDWDQVKLEIVDVGHFLFSEVMAEGYENIFEKHVKIHSDYKNFSGEIDVAYLKRRIKCLISDILDYDNEKNTNRGDEDYDVHAVKGTFFSQLLYSFFDVVSALNLTISDFYALFVGKVCLNQLRWKNGYKKGIYDPSIDIADDKYRDFYIKIWDGVEDNVWLSEHAAQLNSDQPGFKDRLFADLEVKYNQVYTKAWDWVK
jgi:hypothetical protein